MLDRHRMITGEGIMNRQHIADQVIITLGNHVEDFDVKGIVDELLAQHGPIEDVDAVPSDAYWATVKAHDTSTAV
jgi:DNA-binding MltR family transcriptional regulator